MTTVDSSRADGSCAASFFLCLACRNAAVLPHHLPRLMYLRDALDSLGSVLPEEVWSVDWMPHYARLTDALNRSATPEELNMARNAVSD